MQVKYQGTIDLLQQQKQDKDSWTSENKEPEYTPLTLDTATDTKVFDKVKKILAHVQGMTGVPLVYVIRVVLISEDKDNDSPFGDKDTKYTSIKLETTARAPILSDDTNYKEESPHTVAPYNGSLPTGRHPIHTLNHPLTRVPPDYTFPLPPGVHLDDVSSLMRLVDAWELRKANSAIGFWIN